MKWLYYLLLSAGTIGSALSCAVGDTYDQVIAEKGKPASHLEAGAVQILTYPDATIKLRNGIVVSLMTPEPSPPAIGVPSIPHPSPAPSVAPITAPKANEPLSKLSWTTDYNSALDQAKNEHKQVFLFFTGSDWCVWCRRLQREILKTNEFEMYAQEKLVLVELDYPHQKAQSYEVKVQNRMLEGRYNITGFPTVIILDYTGKPVARMGYQEGGPGPFIAKIQALDNSPTS